jgi:hypothetical protein
MSKVIVDEQKAELILEAGIDKSKVKGLYYVGEDGNVWVSRMGGTSKKVYETGILLKKDYRYFVNQQGDIGRYQNKEYTCSECKELKSGAFDSTICKSCYDELEELKINTDSANKGELGPANKIKLRGLFYDYAELFFTLDELKEELENAIKYEVPLSDFILDGFFGCEYEIERYYDDTFFCTGSSGDLVIEDSAGNIITSLQVEDIKTSKVEDEPSDNSDIFRITIEDGYRGDWRKYSLTDAISSESSFDQSLLSFSIMDDGDGSLIKITYDGIELEDYEDVIDARGKSTIIDLEYFDKDGNSKFLDINMDEKELVKSMK